MRIDLTHAAGRVLARAGLPGFIPVSQTGTVLTIEKLLLALLQEEGCRAAEWLDSTGVTEELFRNDFGISANVMKLFSTAPPYPIGAYGVSSGQPNPVQHNDESVDINVQNSAPDRQTNIERQPRKQQQHPQPQQQSHPSSFEQDSVSFGESSPATPPHSNHVPEWIDALKNAKSVLFFIDGEQIDVTRVSEEFETALTIANSRFARLAPSVARSVVGGNLNVIKVVPERSSGKVVFATEHLLFVAVIDEGQVGTWLRDKGFDPTELLDRINAIYQRRDNFEDGLESIDERHGNVTDNVDENVANDLANNIGRNERENIPFDSKKTVDTIYDTEKFYDQFSDRLTNIERNGTLRLLDAVSNRAMEAVRVLEDDVRFLRDDVFLTKLLKDFRHELSGVIARLPFDERLTMRETEYDVGTKLETENEYHRSNAASVRGANFARLQESLRSLEEYTKLKTIASGELSRLFERLRYRAYTLQKIIITAITSDERLNDKRLYVLVDGATNEAEFANLVSGLIGAGVDILQLRDKTADDRTLLTRAKKLRSLTANSKTLFIMNDRPDIAIASDADGIHVGQDELPVHEVRRLVGAKMLIGVSTHSTDQARRAMLEGANYIGAGPVFSSETKNFDASKLLGVEQLKEIISEIRIPTFAIGGINKENIQELIEAGVKRVAIGAAITKAKDPTESVKELRQMM